MSRKFKWNKFDIDGDGECYVIAKDECPSKADVPMFVVKQDTLDTACAPDMVVEEGWCKFQCRTDWDNTDGEPRGWYVVEMDESFSLNLYGKRKAGWFAVWVIRIGEWY